MDMKERPHTFAIKTLKERIKTLAPGQRLIKRARKTLISIEERRDLLKKATVDSMWIGEGDAEAATHACRIVLERKAEITACLNLHDELRGSKQAHGIREGLEYNYKRCMEKLRRELEVS